MKNRKMLQGVSLFLVRQEKKALVNRQILIIEETEKKRWKNPGDYSIPMETKREGESWEKAVHRAIVEEACGITDYEIIGRIGREDFNVLGLIWARCYLVEAEKHENPLTSTEVINHRWMFPEEALGLKLRLGARGMIINFIKHSRRYPLGEVR